MPACKACFHRDRDKIDTQMIERVPYRTINAWSDVPLGTLSRHRAHVIAILKERQPSERAEHGSDLYNRLEKFIAASEEILANAKTARDWKACTAAIGAATRLLELVGRLSGELVAQNVGGLHVTMNRTTNTTININDDTEIAQLVAEATLGFDPGEIERLKLLTEGKIIET
jgi:hypothetical protein